ncbi:MAG: hypothetical protein KF708_24495 [Pirellulales bacterium]|nr:hypothetical protein [Pirellulales bacterium]
MQEHRLAELRRRDAGTLSVLGIFFCVLGVLVVIGTYWTLGHTHAMIVNLGAGLATLGVGLLMLWIGARLRKPIVRQETPSDGVSK